MTINHTSLHYYFSNLCLSRVPKDPVVALDPLENLAAPDLPGPLDQLDKMELLDLV